MKKVEDAELRRLMEQDSIKNTVISYLLTIGYAVVAAFACMAMREMLETVVMKFVYGAALETNQYAGIRRITQIVAIALMVGSWALTFMLVWHKTEKAEGMKARVKVGACWIACAAAAFCVFGLIQLAVVGYWPTLTGSV